MNLNPRKERLLIYEHEKVLAAIRNNGLLRIGANWRLIIDGDDNCVIQHYNGATWDNEFKFVT